MLVDNVLVPAVLIFPDEVEFAKPLALPIYNVDPLFKLSLPAPLINAVIPAGKITVPLIVAKLDTFIEVVVVLPKVIVAPAFIVRLIAVAFVVPAGSVAPVAEVLLTTKLP